MKLAYLHNTAEQLAKECSMQDLVNRCSPSVKPWHWTLKSGNRSPFQLRRCAEMYTEKVDNPLYIYAADLCHVLCI